MNMMNFGDEMKRVADNIMTAYDVRMKGLGQLVLDTHETVKGFAKERKRLHKEQEEGLKNFAGNMHKNVGKMLKAFRENHNEMSEEQAKYLTNFVQGIAKYVSGTLSSYQKERGKAANIKMIRDYVKHKLNEFSCERSDMSEAVKKDLHQYVNGIVGEVHKFQNSTRKLMSGYHNDMKHAHSAWKNMSSTINKIRQAGFTPDIKVGGTGFTTVEEAIKEKRGHHQTKGACKRTHHSKGSAKGRQK